MQLVFCEICGRTKKCKLELTSVDSMQVYLVFFIKSEIKSHVPKCIKVVLGVCFALNSWTEDLLLFTYLIILGKDVTFPLIKKLKTNKYLSYISVNRIPN